MSDIYWVVRTGVLPEVSRIFKEKDKDKNMEVAQTPRSQDCFADSRWPSASSRQ